MYKVESVDNKTWQIVLMTYSVLQADSFQKSADKFSYG